MKFNFGVIVMYLSEVVIRMDIYVGVVKNYLNNLKNVNMLKIMFLLLDILDILVNLFKVIFFEKLIMLFYFNNFIII